MLWLKVPKGRVHVAGDSMAADSRHDGRNERLRVHILNDKNKTEKADWKFYSQSPSPVSYFLLSCPNQHHQLWVKGSNAQDCEGPSD